MPFIGTLGGVFAFSILKGSGTAPPSALQYFQVTAANWTAYWSNLYSSLMTANAGCNTTITQPNVSTTIGGTGRCLGAILAPNGRLFGIPSGLTSNLYIDTATDTVVTFSNGSSLGTAGWSGGALGANGIIYTVPNANATFMAIDPVALTQTVYTTAAGGWTFTSSGWAGAVLAPNGKIYCGPASANNILCINPATNTASNVPTAGKPSISATACYSAILAPNGFIYFTPFTATRFIKFNPTDETYTPITITGTTTTYQWRSAVLAPNGKIYMAPNYTPTPASNMIVIDTNTDTGALVSMTAESGSSASFPLAGMFNGGAMGPDGYIYYAPYSGTYVLRVNPNVNPPSFSNLFTSTNAGATKWRSATLAPNGNIYFMPFSCNRIGKLSFTLNQLPGSNLCLTPYLNHTN
jgi:streptogramin lyase